MGGSVYPPAVQHRRSGLRLRYSLLRDALQARRDRAVPPIKDALATCFVVGCGSSGTTLLAARLGNHPEVLALREESNLFAPRRSLAAARARLAGWMAAARERGARVLVEKTPKHVHAVGRIRRLLPEARIVVMLRDPLDVCASLARRPKAAAWGGLEHAIERWVVDNGAALALLGGPGVLAVRYEALTERPEHEFRRVLAFLGLDWTPSVLEGVPGGRPAATETMRLRSAQVSEPIRPNAGRWREAFSAGEVARVHARTGPLWRALAGPDAMWLEPGPSDRV
jgi:Sulfotransferase family